MARIDDLRPDQRAALQLILKQGRSYEDIAQLLKIDTSAVAERARSALDALGPEEVAGFSLEHQDEVADFLLGQQTASQRASTRAFLEHSAPARAWARTVSGELREAGPAFVANLPEIPAEAAEVDQAFDALQAREAHRERVERSSRVGGAILIAALVIAVVGVILLATGAFSGGDSSSSDKTKTTATTGTSTQSAETPQVEAQVNMTPPQGSSSKAAGVAQVARQGGQRAVALVAQGIPAASANPPRYYAIWLYSSPQKAKFLGFPKPQPGKDGRIETGFGLPADANQYSALILTRETVQQPKTPGAVVLRGPLDLPAK